MEEKPILYAYVERINKISTWEYRGVPRKEEHEYITVLKESGEVETFFSWDRLLEDLVENLWKEFPGYYHVNPRFVPVPNVPTIKEWRSGTCYTKVETRTYELYI